MPVSIPKVDLKSQSITKEQKEKLRQLFPEVFSEDTIDFEKLKLTLGADAETVKERFGLTWSGKAECFRIIQEPSIGTLKPAKGESVDWDSTENLFIEGDNLETLKLLQKSYYGKVKMIYIDPPYNTGNEFIYPDKFSETLDTYLSYSGQADAEGRKFSTNSETGGRYHSKWLDMMYPRLFLARNLLRDDGVIFISIDDHEVHNLREMMNEIYGEENFIGEFVWQSKKGGGSDKGGVVNDQEYVICYRKSETENALSRIEIESEELDEQDEIGAFRKGRELNKWGAGSSRSDRPTMWYPIPGPDGEVFPIRNDGSEGRWRLKKKNLLALVEKGDVEFEKRPDGTYIAYEKIRSTDPRFKPYRTWLTDIGTTADGSKELKKIFDGKKVYDFPKPVSLLTNLLSIGSNEEDDIILDFFAGSCTTSHALIKLNREGDTNRKFICIQLPESVNDTTSTGKNAIELGMPTLAEVGKERIRRVIDKIKQEQKESAKQKKLADDPETPQDLGFRVFKLSKSNFKVWNGQVPADGKVEKQLEDFIENLHNDGTDEEILYELLLKSGFALTIPVTEKKIAGKKVYSIDSDTLLICLEHNLTKDLIVKMAEIKPARAICLDAGFKGNDQLRTNALEIMKSHGVTDFRTV
ncbi:MAG: site-specific DNA-methyltransferase [Methanomicrobiales archaeon HGW-Methanomicrobiales-1]|jgi:adenine-specific DNA-methyltransferase|nr:MAG: site-specific DNA-methyltransferase [Methanomicrobiales archaeon HGW-Methanomicrobiales-1]